MSQAKKVLSILLATVMLLTAIPMSVYARHTDYTEARGYDILDKPFVTPDQAASMILDMLDELLAEEDMTFEVDIKVSSRTVDLRSVDRLTSSLTRLWDWGWLKFAFGILNFGDLEKMNMHWIQNAPKRTDPDKTDMDVLMALVKFVKDNHERIGKIIDDTFNYGFVTTVTTLPAEVHNIPGEIKKPILKALNNKEDPPEGTTIDSLVQNLIDGLLVGEIDPNTGKYDGLMPSLKGKVNLNTLSVYDLVTNIINAAMTDIVVPLLGRLLLELGGVKFTDQYPEGDPSSATNLDLVLGIIEFIAGEIPYRPEDLETPLKQMTAAMNYMFVEGGMDEFFELNETGLQIHQEFIELFDDLIRLALSLMPGLGFLKQTKEFKTEEEVEAMTIPECHAYLGRLLLNEFIPFADIPETAVTFKAVLTHLLIGLAKDVLPETNYDAMLESGVLNPDGDAIYIIGTALGTHYLNGLLPIDIPQGLSFEQVIEVIFDWAIENYGGLFYTGNILPTDTVWQKIDKIIFSIIPANWMPAHITGSKDLVMDWLIGNALEFDYVGLLSIIKRNPNSELNNSVVKVLLNTLSRLLKGMLGNNTILPMNLSSLDEIFTKSVMRAFVQNLCRYLADYGLALFGDLFPILTQLIGIWSNETYIRKAPQGAPLVGIEELQALLDSYTPRNLNENMQYYEAGYHFFGAEDFKELRNYFNYNDAKKEVQGLLDAYAKDPESLDLLKNTDAAFRVTYYFNELQMRDELCVIQLTNEIIKVNNLELDEADHSRASWENFQNALNFAHKTRNDAITREEGLRQSQISAARQNLFKAVKALEDFVPYADYTQFDSYLRDAKNKLATLPPDVFTPESVENLENAVANADVFDRQLEYERQDEVDDMAALIYTAIYGLIYILPPALKPVENSSQDFWGNPITPIVDDVRRYIYGLEVGGFNPDMLYTEGGASFTVIPTAQGYGTGTRVRLMVGGSLRATYTVVLFGDVNGDGNIDDGDNGLIIDVENHIINWNSSPDKRFAADLNGDGSIDMQDAGIVTEVMNYMAAIDQRDNVLIDILN